MAKYSQRRIRKLLSDSDSAPTSDAKGEILETLIKYVFEKVPGVSFLDRNFLDSSQTQEIDLAFWNLQSQSALCFLEAIIFIECKNTSSPIGSGEVSWFIRKVQDRGACYGILVTLNGITGSSDDNNCAYSQILGSLIRDKIKILIVTREELLNLNTTDDLVTLLKGKICSLMLYKTIH